MKTKKMYVLVRKDLDETYRNVQGCHSVAEYSLKGDKDLYQEWNNHTLVYLAVKDQWALDRWGHKLKRLGKHFIPFHEPDLAGSITAIACIDDGDIFRHLQLA